MVDVKKPINTLELATAAVSLAKTAAVVFVMMMLEWARLRERKAVLAASKSENDLEIAKATAKLEGAKEGKSAKDQVDEYLRGHGLGASKPFDGQG